SLWRNSDRPEIDQAVRQRPYGLQPDEVSEVHHVAETSLLHVCVARVVGAEEDLNHEVVAQLELSLHPDPSELGDGELLTSRQRRVDSIDDAQALIQPEPFRI